MAGKTNCTINGKDYYRIRKKIGEDINGKDIVKNFYGKNKTDAENKYKDFMVDRQSNFKTEKEYFGKLMHYFIYEVMLKSKLSDGTKVLYKKAYEKYIQSSTLSNYLMSEINSKIIQSFLNDLTENKKPVRKLYKVLSLFFKYADSEGYCRNPMPTVYIDSNGTVKGDIEVFSHKEVDKIINAKCSVRNERYRLLYVFTLATGLRMGEVVALQWSDIKNGSVNVCRQAVYDTEGKITISRTKTPNSIRNIPIPKYILDQLMAQPRNSEYIFTTSTGTLIDKINLRISFKRFLKNIGVDYKSFHTLRKTYCTMLCENGVPIQVASRLMGHSSIAVTAKYYAFVSDKEKDEAADKINDIIIGTKAEAKKRLKPTKRKIKAME